MSLLERVGEHVRENRSGMFVDLVFAMAWVTLVSVVFAVLPPAPQWAYYLAMASGIVAYYGFFWSLEALRAEES
ncbi:hypothetical protein [Haloarcula nitratireducens]|uniref:DUF8119 domain-containing protein n=1 Tax=Haloarcula nitratireducens TaxID=2487749 RepID=A0AAW4PES3_9EURY|nr:hypothetical protein [Halomicroarcula nitratireducens]MBX0296386.1 hypothetical protein [Halomicroarcula nitratireducens]